MRLNRPAAAHLLRRAAVGATNGTVNSFFGLTREEAVDRLLDRSASPALPSYSSLQRDGDWRTQEAMIDWWVDRMIDAPPSIEEKLTLFWHSHFATAREKVEDAELIWDQHLELRRHGFGDFRTLLGKISFGSAMLIYLDNETNVAGAEQENFARELMELHTIGNARFSEEDVISMARAWTGHNTVGRTPENNWEYDPTYIFRPEDHDDGQKTLFGVTRNWDAADTLDEICFGAKEEDFSQFITGKLFRYFVHTDPSDAVIADLAAGFRSTGGNITQLVRSILLHDEFWAEETRYALIKSPVEYMVDIMRRCGLRSRDESVRWRMEGMGMTLFDPPNVAGWGQNGFWLGTATAWAKSRWVNSLKWRADDRNLLQDLDDLTPEEAVDRMTAFFGLYDVSSQSRNHARDLIEVTQRDRPWAMKYEPFAMGLFMPEVQCA